MPDISKCNNNNCPSKDSCYRFTSQPSPFWQSYSDFKFDEKTGKCDHYWNDAEYKKSMYQKTIDNLNKKENEQDN